MTLERRGRIIGIDWGTKRIGIALSDESATLATPFTTLDATPVDSLLSKLGKIIHDEQVTKIVVGLPINIDGSEGESAKSARRFVESLKRFELPVDMCDERYSSYTANQILVQQNRKPSRNKKLVDQAAAAIMLQGYLDSSD